MNDQIKYVITKNIKSAEMIINGNWKEGDKTARVELPMGKKILKSSYKRILNYIMQIIKLKRAIKSIGVNDNS